MTTRHRSHLLLALATVAGGLIITQAPVSASTEPSPGDVVIVEPGRVWDSRAAGSTVDGLAVATGSVVAGGGFEVDIAGRQGVADDALGVVAHLTAINPSAGGFATLYPCSDEVPGVSALNFVAGVTVANTTTVKLSDVGSICVFSSAASNFALDVVGYVPAGSASIVEPGRVWDSRPAGETVDRLAMGTGRVPAGDGFEVGIVGRLSVPNDATGVVVNLTAIGPLAGGFATLYPCSDEVPGVSALNFVAGVTVANTTTVKLSGDGSVCVFSSAESHFALDVVGYVPAASAGCSDLATQVECDALASLFASTAGAGWVNQDGWLTDTDACTWYGVTCGPTGVEGLNLGLNGLDGELPEDLGDLSNLTDFNVGNQTSAAFAQSAGVGQASIATAANNIDGADRVTELENVEQLDLWELGLTELPAGIGDMTSLVTLFASFNELTALPPEIGQLTNLERLYLDGNDINSLPDEVASLSNLKQLQLNNNGVTNVPPVIGQITSLETLDLAANQVSTLPASFSNLTNLTFLSLFQNQLATWPTAISGLTQLEALQLANNDMDVFPPELAAFTNLELLTLTNTSFQPVDVSAIFEPLRQADTLRNIALNGSCILIDDPVVKAWVIENAFFGSWDETIGC